MFGSTRHAALLPFLFTAVVGFTGLKADIANISISIDILTVSLRDVDGSALHEEYAGPCLITI
jgi:hypothetical protein